MGVLDGRVCLVTGGSRGLGRSMILAFAEAGADVVIASRKADSCVALAAEVEERFGVQALGVGCHVAHWDECDALAEAALERFGRVDVLVNNAGMSPLYERVADITEELWDKTVDVNLKGPFRLSAVLGTRMVEDGTGGSIINVSTVGAVRPYAGIVPYAASKAGVHAMTVALADAFGPTVRVNCIMPGAFRTDVTAHWSEGMLEAAAAAVPLKRVAEPDEIVGTALWLATDASGFVTGAVIPVTGGGH